MRITEVRVRARRTLNFQEEHISSHNPEIELRAVLEAGDDVESVVPRLQDYAETLIICHELSIRGEIKRSRGSLESLEDQMNAARAALGEIRARYYARRKELFPQSDEEKDAVSADRA
jgi:hypothetical protein